MIRTVPREHGASGGEPRDAPARSRAHSLSPAAGVGLASALRCTGRHDEAIRQLQMVLELQPAFPQALWQLGMVHLAERRYADAIRAFEAVTRDGSLGYAYAVAGRKAEARAVLLRSRGGIEDAVHLPVGARARSRRIGRPRRGARLARARPRHARRATVHDQDRRPSRRAPRDLPVPSPPGPHEPRRVIAASLVAGRPQPARHTRIMRARASRS